MHPYLFSDSDAVHCDEMSDRAMFTPSPIAEADRHVGGRDEEDVKEKNWIRIDNLGLMN